MGRTKDSHRAAQPHPRLSLGPYKQSPVKEKARKEQQAPVTKAKATLKENRAPAPKRVLVEKKEETRSSKAAKVEESSAKGLFRYRLCLASDKDLVKIQQHNKAVVSEAAVELIVEDFWPLFDAYNLEAARPPSVPGLEFFIKELGPLVPTRSTLADDCLGCGGLIDEGEFFFWFPRELFLVSAHFCHPCVAYWMDRLQKRRAKPSGPAVNIKTLTEVVKAKYPQFYDVDKETSPDC